MKAQTKYRRGEDPSPEKIPLEHHPNPLAAKTGSLFAYLAAVLSNVAQELSRDSKKESRCVLCSDAILSTQVASEDDGKPVHALCFEMKLRKKALVQTVRSQEHACALCGQEVQPTGIYFHEAGLTLSYACEEPAHGEPNLFSLPVSSDESKRVGMWEARLRDRLKEKGYVRCCECGRLIRAEAAQLLGPGWHYCGCLPELWKTGP